MGYQTFRETCDLKATQRFFRGARAVVGHAPDRVTTDGVEQVRGFGSFEAAARFCAAHSKQ